jgi:hypothetical protein
MTSEERRHKVKQLLMEYDRLVTELMAIRNKSDKLRIMIYKVNKQILEVKNV